MGSERGRRPSLSLFRRVKRPEGAVPPVGLQEVFVPLRKAWGTSVFNLRTPTVISRTSVFDLRRSTVSPSTSVFNLRRSTVSPSTGVFDLRHFDAIAPAGTPQALPLPVQILDAPVYILDTPLHGRFR